MTRGHKATREEAVTKKIIEILSDLRLDLDMVGLYFGKYARLTIYRRLEAVYETAREYRERSDEKDRERHYEYIKHI